MDIIDNFCGNQILPEAIQGIGIAIITIFVSIATILYPKYVLLMDIIDNFFKNKILPETIQGIGIAIITIFVSIATILYPKIESENAEDIVKQHLLFRKVIRFKSIPIGVGLVYLPFLLWHIELSLVRAVLFAFSFLGIIILCASLYRLGKWLLAKDQQDTGIDENYINKLMKEYLTSELNNIDDYRRKRNLFFMLWGKKYLDNQIYIEKKYFDYFLVYLRKAWKRQQVSHIESGSYDDVFYWSLHRYNQLLSNRNLKTLYLLHYFTEKWLELYFENFSFSGDITTYNIEISRIIENHIEAHFNYMHLYSLFPLMETSTKGKPDTAIELLFFHSSFIKLSFKTSYIWNNPSGSLFPKQWRLDIEKEPVLDIYNKLWVKAFLDIALNKYSIGFAQSASDGSRKNFEKIEKIIDNQRIVETLFPGIDPQIFDDFLAIIYLGYNSDDGKIKSVINRIPRFFSGIKQVGEAYSGERLSRDEERKEYKKYRRKTMLVTFKIVTILFGSNSYISPSQIKKYISELIELKSGYEKGTPQFYQALMLLRNLKYFHYYLRNK